MTSILGIDPGPVESGLCWLLDGRPASPAICSTEKALLAIWAAPPSTIVVIEKLECYGMAVGAEVFETAYVIGRLQQTVFDAAARGKEIGFVMLPRRAVKSHLCNSAKAKDANIAQALKDRFGGKGTRKKPGALFGIKDHAWSALALAVTFAEMREAVRA